MLTWCRPQSQWRMIAFPQPPAGSTAESLQISSTRPIAALVPGELMRQTPPPDSIGRSCTLEPRVGNRGTPGKTTDAYAIPGLHSASWRLSTGMRCTCGLFLCFVGKPESADRPRESKMSTPDRVARLCFRELDLLPSIGPKVRRIEPPFEIRFSRRPFGIEHGEPCRIAVSPFDHHVLTKNSLEGKAEAQRRSSVTVR